MTRTLTARFDGRALIPDEPVDLPIDQTLSITIEEPISGHIPVLSDPNATLEEKLAAIRYTFSLGVEGVNLPDEALRRENIYGDDGR